jgi:NADH-quinone oxidoreductase subunit H
VPPGGADGAGAGHGSYPTPPMPEQSWNQKEGVRR